jgi:hypothetical protein
VRLIQGLVGALGFSFLASAGCGGASFTGDDRVQAGTGGASGSGVGGSSAGGTMSAGGTTSTGGTAGTATGGNGTSGTGAAAGRGGSGQGGSAGAQGGSVALGGSAGVGTAGGSAGTPGGTGGTSGTGNGGAAGGPGDVCRLPPDSGPCEAAIDRWFFNAERGVCQPFVYGGCEGNGNNFQSLEACHATCAGQGTVDPTACDGPTDCVVTAAQCCGGSSTPTLKDVTAVNASALAAFTLPCQLVDCAPTLGPIPSSIGATCRAGHCLAFDLRETELVTCDVADDCTLRLGVGCCERCTGEGRDFVALRRDAKLSELVCGDGPVGCPACVPVPDPTLSAECRVGRCEVVQSGGVPEK